jgi:hypothetical protein
MLCLCFPLLADVLDDVKRELRTSDKALAIDLGFDSPAEYAKAKHGIRPWSRARVLTAPNAVQAAFLLVWNRLRVAETIPPPAETSDADLIEDIFARVQALAARAKQAKADIRLVQRKDVA